MTLKITSRSSCAIVGSVTPKQYACQICASRWGRRSTLAGRGFFQVGAVRNRSVISGKSPICRVGIGGNLPMPPVFKRAGIRDRYQTKRSTDPHNQEYFDESIEGLIKDAFYQAPK